MFHPDGSLGFSLATCHRMFPRPGGSSKCVFVCTSVPLQIGYKGLQTAGQIQELVVASCGERRETKRPVNGPDRAVRE